MLKSKERKESKESKAFKLAEEGYDNAEIAAVLGIPKEQARNSVSRHSKTKKRKVIRLYLTDRNYDLLLKEAEPRGIDVAGLVRTLISKHLLEGKRR